MINQKFKSCNFAVRQNKLEKRLRPRGSSAKIIYIIKTYDFRTELLCGVVQRCHATTRVPHQPAASIETDSTVARVTLGERAGIHKPTKKEAIDQYVSRFKKNN